jgi:hypothetical protein
MKFHVFFTEGSETDPFKSGNVEAGETVEAPGPVEAAVLGHSYFGLDEDATGIFVVVPVEDCKIVRLEVKAMPDFILMPDSKPIVKTKRRKPTPKGNLPLR